jgi:hypothetical protein
MDPPYAYGVPLVLPAGFDAANDEEELTRTGRRFSELGPTRVPYAALSDRSRSGGGGGSDLKTIFSRIFSSSKSTGNHNRTSFDHGGERNTFISIQTKTLLRDKASSLSSSSSGSSSSRPASLFEGLQGSGGSGNSAASAGNQQQQQRSASPAFGQASQGNPSGAYINQKKDPDFERVLGDWLRRTHGLPAEPWACPNSRMSAHRRPGSPVPPAVASAAGADPTKQPTAMSDIDPENFRGVGSGAAAPAVPRGVVRWPSFFNAESEDFDAEPWAHETGLQYEFLMPTSQQWGALHKLRKRVANPSRDEEGIRIIRRCVSKKLFFQFAFFLFQNMLICFIFSHLKLLLAVAHVGNHLPT